jgi:hypothetical protein
MVATAWQTVSQAGGILSRDLIDLFLKVVTVNCVTALSTFLKCAGNSDHTRLMTINDNY